MKFTVSSEKPGPLLLNKLLEQHANSLWVPDYLSEEQAAAFVLDHFRRQIETEMGMIEVTVANASEY
jgi:hypothetical protein